MLALATGYTVFEAISPTGILSRALIYGPGLALLWVVALLVFEVFFSRRAWCRYACPIGLTYDVTPVLARGGRGITLVAGDDGVIPNYHWPTDTPENLDPDSLVRALEVARRMVAAVDRGEAD